MIPETNQDSKNDVIEKAESNGEEIVEAEEFVPHVTHDDFKEITVRGIIMSIFLTIVLGAANVYLGLYVSLTVSASIPASVLATALLKCFKDSNILEVNIVQTAASSGEALAAGAIFTLPGMVIMNTQRDLGNPVFEGVEGWDTFLGSNYLYGTFLCMFGGFLGICWSIPLRRALILEIEPPLKFPEGVATAQVVKSGEKGASGSLAILAGGILGTVATLFDSLGICNPLMGFGWFYNGAYPSYFALNVKAALLGVGYIVGPNIAGVLFLGSMLHYWVVIPASSAIRGGYPESEWNTTELGPHDPKTATNLEFGDTRYIGIGLMVVGGIWSLITIRTALTTAVKMGIQEFKKCGKVDMKSTKRTERDIPFSILFFVIVGSIIPLYIMFSYYSDEWGYCVVMATFVILTSFLFSAVAAYMAGLVGSSNNPVSGVTICSCLILSGLIIGMFGADNPMGPPTTVIMCTAVACACAIAGDNIQDLKSGHLLGGTPWKQEAVMLLGVGVTSLVIPAILELLDAAYVLGVGLEAPQATIIATIPVGLANGTLPWDYIGAGAALGVLIIILDKILESKGCSFRLPVLAFAVSFYLPIYYLTPIFLGSLVHFVAGSNPDNQASEGILYSAGLIAGDAITGIIMAIPIVVLGSSDALKVIEDPQVWPSVILMFAIFGSMAYVGRYSPFTKREQKALADKEVRQETQRSLSEESIDLDTKSQQSTI